MSLKYVLSKTKGRVAYLTLNRPEQLNSLFMPLIKEALSVLREAASNSELRCVILRGAGAKAFCAGGDIKTLAVAIKESDMDAVSEQTRGEYSLVYRVANHKLPTISLVDGICMGTGGGLLIHAKFGVVTEKATFAMPETAIGIAPDAGVTQILARLRNYLGVFLGLSGHRLRGSCIFRAGVASHFVSSDMLPSLQRSLELAEDSKKIEEMLSDAHQKSIPSQTPFSLEDQLHVIDECFRKDSVEGIIECLEGSEEWGKAQAAHLLSMSPTGLKVTLEHITRSRDIPRLLDVLTNDYRLIHQLSGKHNDFVEGVSALLIDKNRKPQWNPASLRDVDDRIVKNLFNPLPSSADEFTPML